MIAITEKPTRVKPTDQPQMGETTEADLIELKEKLDALKRVPKSKNNLPMTTNQELGWDMDTEFKTHKPSYGFNKTMCNECKYANSYVTMTSRSPFAAPRPTAGGPGGK